MLRKISPKLAGAGAITCGVVVAIIAGVMIAYPPLSIAGAVVLVLATILMSVGCVWLVRRSWDEPWPEVRLNHAKLLRRRRFLLIVSGALVPIALAWGISSALLGTWGMLALALVFVFNAAINLWIYLRVRAILFSKRD